MRIFTLLSFTFLIWSSQAQDVYTEFESKESPVNGTLVTHVKIKASDSVWIYPGWIWEAPVGIQIQENLSAPQLLMEGDSMLVEVVFTYPTSYSPYYPVGFEVEVPLNGSLLTNAKAVDPIIASSSLSGNGKLYFTPWHTVELWDIATFGDLNREWELPVYPSPEKMFFDAGGVPVSSLEHFTEEYDEDTIQSLKVPGLAYQIPMFPSHKVLYNYPVGDDLDADAEPEEIPASNAKIAIIRKFKGQVKGRMVTHYKNDLGQRVTIPLSGVNITLKDRDKAFINEKLAEVTSDKNGYFTINYDVNQSFIEGKEMELFLKFKSKTEHRNLKVTKRLNLSRSYVRNWEIGAHGEDAQVNVGDIVLNDDEFKVLHWANRAWDFMEAHGIGVRTGLRIQPHADLIGFRYNENVDYTFNFPFFHLKKGTEKLEGETYHHMGVFFMHDKYRESLFQWYKHPHDWSRQNTSAAAWIEGWGNGMEMILDAYYREEDGEYGFNGLLDKEIPRYEQRDTKYQKNRQGNIERGIWSEYYIGCAIYDLWDGPDKGLPETLPGSNKHGYNDKGDVGGTTDNNEELWESTDDISYSFQFLYNALKNNPQLCRLYYEALIKSVDDCSKKAEIARCFKENNVVYDVVDQDKGLNTQIAVVFPTYREYEDNHQGIPPPIHDNQHVGFINLYEETNKVVFIGDEPYEY